MWDLRSLHNNVWVVQFIFLVPLEKGALKFEIALELFSYIFGWQPLEKGILKFEIALDVFISFFWWQHLEKGVMEI